MRWSVLCESPWASLESKAVELPVLHQESIMKTFLISISALLASFASAVFADT
jgi:hypothetical protein